MSNPTPRFEILILAGDTDTRTQLSAQALGALLDVDPDTNPDMFAPVRLRIRQTGRDVFDRSGALLGVLYKLTDWGYSETAADWGYPERL